MRRAVLWGVSVVFAAALVGCGGNNNNADSGSATDAGGGDAGAPGGTVTVATHNNQLPAPWASTNAADFKVDDTGAASAYLNTLVELNVPTTTSSSTCPAIFVYHATNGNTYCNGFSATTADGGVLNIATYSYLSSAGSSSCISAAATGMPMKITGVWTDYYNSQVTPKDNFVIALADCSVLGQGTAYTGTGTSPAPPSGSQTVHSLIASGASSGVTVTASGVVTAAWSGSTEFGFAMQDPGATSGSQTGIYVQKGKNSTSTSSPPAIGDFVTATGTYKTFTTGAATTQEIDL